MIIKRGTEDLSNIKIEQILETPRRTSQTNATSPSQRRRRAGKSQNNATLLLQHRRRSGESQINGSLHGLEWFETCMLH